EATGTDKQPQVTESAATEPTTTDLVAADVVEMKEPGEAVVAEVTNDRTIWQSEQQPEQPPTLQSEQQPVNNGFAQVQTKPDAAEKVESEVESEVEAEQSAMADGAHSAGDKVAIADAEGVTQGSVEKTSVEKGSVEQSSAEQAFVSSEIEKQLENVDEQGRVIDEPQNGDAVKADWITARKSFYQRNYELSEQSYQKVIDNTENNFDAYGELGNVYFNQGKNQQAASAYFEAAAILVRTGQVDRARSLMGLLHHLDKSKASELQQLIDTVQS
ncbi:MAG: tetratricopeptide repeat protein, partial [Gammaproteobacteria bacterium]